MFATLFILTRKLDNFGNEIFLGKLSSNGALVLNDNLSNYRKIIIETHDNESSGYDSVKVRTSISVSRFKTYNTSKKAIENRIYAGDSNYINTIYYMSNNTVQIEYKFGTIFIYGER